MKKGQNYPVNSGVALLTVVLFSAVAAVLAAGLHFAAGSQLSSVRRQVRMEKAFAIAEAGVERAKAELMWTNSLADIHGTLFDLEYGDGTYSVWIATNDPSMDTVVIWSTGIFQNVERVLKVCVSVPEIPSLPTETDAGVIIYGTNSSITLKGTADLDGGMDKPGLISESTNITINGAANIAGSPTNIVYGAATEDLDYWAELGAMLTQIVINNHLVDDRFFFFENENVTATTLGTTNNPAITVASGTVKITGQVNGVGVLIITGDAVGAGGGAIEIETELGGNFLYHGLIILLDGDCNLDFQGTPQVYGSVISLGDNNRIGPAGTPLIQYCSTGLSYLSKLNYLTPPRRLTVENWRQVK